MKSSPRPPAGRSVCVCVWMRACVREWDALNGFKGNQMKGRGQNVPMFPLSKKKKEHFGVTEIELVFVSCSFMLEFGLN